MQNKKIAEILLIVKQKLMNHGIKSWNLDSELIISHVLNLSRLELITKDEDFVIKEQQNLIDELISRRISGEPLAYLLNKKEFYGRDFYVDNSVLIPRIETESIIFNLPQDNRPKKVLDIGTGSGCIAITIKLEKPNYHVDALDISENALKTAELNAKKLNANVHFFHSNLLSNVKDKYDLIIANLPYVDDSWNIDLNALSYEPSSALFAKREGLDLIYKLLDEVDKIANQNALLYLESDETQIPKIIEYTKNKKSIRFIKADGLISIFRINSILN
jgi:protein-(glutamine-N5) methyltransferase, release factor-specific